MLFRPSNQIEFKSDKKAESLQFSGNFSSKLIGIELRQLEKEIGAIVPGGCLCYITNGAWGMPDLLEYLLRQTGPADVWLTSWTISEKPIQRLKILKKEGLIRHIIMRLDERISQLKADAYAALQELPDKLTTTRIHAKVFVIQNESHSVVCVGSANFSKNPREEAGVIIYQAETADFYKKWIESGLRN